jgi:alkylresorcinol/alkylpyrone synthase
MGWDIKNDGFGIVLSPQLPALLQDNLGAAIDGFLARNGLTRDDLDGFLFHPGGGKIIDVAERVLGLAADALEPSRRILRDYGNMSSATALFVLEEALASGRRGRHLLAAFGPGFSAYFAVIDL